MRAPYRWLGTAGVGQVAIAGTLRGLDLGAFLARTRLTLSLECGVAAVDLHLEVALQPEASAGVQLGNRGSQASTSSGITSADPKVTALRRRLVGEAEAQLAAGGEALSDEFLARWLRARGRDVVAAEEAVRAHARWRAEFVPKGRVLEEDIRTELAAEKVFLQGVDLRGRPVLVVWAARHYMSGRRLEETTRLICYTLDAAAANADLTANPLGQFLVIFDLSGIGMGNLDVKALQTVFELLQQHYPECLSELCFLNAPFIFWGMWRVVSPFIQPATKQKIQFLSGAKRQAMLEGTIPPHVLPKVYGGSARMVAIEEAAARLRSARVPSGSLSRRGADPEHRSGRLSTVKRWAGGAGGWVRSHNPLPNPLLLLPRAWEKVKGVPGAVGRMRERHSQTRQEKRREKEAAAADRRARGLAVEGYDGPLSREQIAALLWGLLRLLQLCLAEVFCFVWNLAARRNFVPRLEGLPTSSILPWPRGQTPPQETLSDAPYDPAREGQSEAARFIVATTESSLRRLDSHPLKWQSHPLKGSTPNLAALS